MKVEGNARGGKEKASRGRGRGKRTDYQSTDLVVTVPNEESSSSRLKLPVTVSQPRKIVRLNRKTGKLLFSVYYSRKQCAKLLIGLLCV